jgi:putative restriction endonuclease
MSQSSQSSDPQPSSSQAAPERLAVDEYRRRAAKGEFGPIGSMEFLEGIVIAKPRQSLRSEGAVVKIQEVLFKLLPEGWQLRVQQPMVTVDSQPEPDVAIVSESLDGYVDRPPRAEDVPLVIEAADVSLIQDRRLKCRVYARAGILNYWLLNLLDSQLEVFTNPSGPVPMPGYHEQRIYRSDDKISLVLGLDDLGMIRVADMIP